MKSITSGKRLTEVRKEKKISQEALAKNINVHWVVIDHYERDEVKPSMEVDAQIAEALEVSLDYLLGNTNLMLDNTIIHRIQDIQQLDSKNRWHLFALMDVFVRDYKTKQAYVR